ncbi:uncharacterized protein LOC103512466 [Diaphorina citri]|uniref:Uncharacterized protein LOC103512466 n=1 Tax=Diaphorina citri TaxID=121845 RepID=A0A3Q0IZP9_DIACI|nr:uncharacterized protein LOC103512466 [Diaphorina citri]
MNFHIIHVLIMGIFQLHLSLAQISPENYSNKNGKQFNTNSILSPRMEYDDWTPLGRGDPLKNDPTYDYVPPMLDKVKYWMTDSDSSRKQINSATTNSDDILLLGVSALKKSTSKPNKKYTSEKPNLLDPAYTHNHKGKTPSYNVYDKDSNNIDTQYKTNKLASVKSGFTFSDNYVKDSSEMNSEKRTDPLETLLQFVSGKWNVPYSTTPTKPIASLQQTHHQQQHQQQLFQLQHQNHDQKHQEQLFKQQQELKQQYEQQLVKVPDIMLIPPVDTTSSNTWFLSEPTDNQLFIQAQNSSNFNFKPADNVTDLYDLVSQNHLVTPTSYDVQTSLKFQDVITQANYPLIYQSNISTYTSTPAIIPTTIKVQDITPTSYKPQDTPTLGNTITSVDYKSQSQVPIITPIGLKIQNIPAPTTLKQNDISVTYPKLQTSVTPFSKLPSVLPSVTPTNFKPNSLFVTPIIYKTNYVTETSKLTQPTWITPSVPSIFSVPHKFTTPSNQIIIKQSNSLPPNIKVQNHQTFSNWKLAQNQIYYNNPKFTTHSQQTFNHNEMFPPMKTNSFQTNTFVSTTTTTAAPSTIIFCNQTLTNISLDEKKVTENSTPNKTILAAKQSLPTMNLIIQGHSKVKKYGASKVDKVTGIPIQGDDKENKSRKSRELRRYFESNENKRSRRKRKLKDKFSKTNRQLEVVEELIPVYDEDLEEVLEDLVRQQGQGSGFGQIEDNTIQKSDPAFR